MLEKQILEDLSSRLTSPSVTAFTPIKPEVYSQMKAAGFLNHSETYSDVEALWYMRRVFNPCPDNIHSELEFQEKKHSPTKMAHVRKYILNNDKKTLPSLLLKYFVGKTVLDKSGYREGYGGRNDPSYAQWFSKRTPQIAEIRQALTKTA